MYCGVSPRNTTSLAKYGLREARIVHMRMFTLDFHSTSQQPIKGHGSTGKDRYDAESKGHCLPFRDD